jgi:hypothetical protein
MDRAVEPVTHGFSTEGRGLLSGFQHEGESTSGQPRGWKMFDTDRIHELEVLDVVLLTGHRERGHLLPFGIVKVHCSL